ncbi:MAG TPA: HAMP domain-containing sensor histidine kinase, partial [Gemmatirosa sp.]
GTVLLAASPAPALVTLRTAGAPVRVYTSTYRFAGRELTVGVSQSLAPQQRTLADARTALAVGVPLMLVAAVVGGYALARRSLQPVATMTRQAAHISAGTLHERLPVADPRDELGRLAAVFNELLGRMEEAFARQRRFVADASHELRTPVAIIAGEAELALAREGRDADALRAALATIGGETGRLQQIVGDLFLLARADAGERPRAVEELYLADLVASVTHAVRTLAARKGVTVNEHVDGDLPFRGDEGLLHRLLLNLVDNAIKFTPAGGCVTVTAAQRGVAYVVQVADTGPGIAPEDQARVFERFFRAHSAEGAAGTGSGAGLGLAIARWIAEAHEGTLQLTHSGAEGSTFAVTLPAPNESPAG